MKLKRFAAYILAVSGTIVVAASLVARAEVTAAPKKRKTGGNLDFWLNQATTAPSSRPADVPARSGRNPFSSGGRPFRPDAVPGVIELSDNTQLPGWLYTTRDKPWVVFDPKLERWRQIPFITVLSITAVVTEEKYLLQWRWKGMGEPEKVFTGRKYPYRRFLWKFRLIDGTTVTGAVKGQPIWVRWDRKATGPMVLHERDKGKLDRKLEDVTYVRKVVVSTKMRDAVLADRKSPAVSAARTRPAK